MLPVESAYDNGAFKNIAIMIRIAVALISIVRGGAQGSELL